MKNMFDIAWNFVVYTSHTWRRPLLRLVFVKAKAVAGCESWRLFANQAMMLPSPNFESRVKSSEDFFHFFLLGSLLADFE